MFRVVILNGPKPIQNLYTNLVILNTKWTNRDTKWTNRDTKWTNHITKLDNLYVF